MVRGKLGQPTMNTALGTSAQRAAEIVRTLQRADYAAFWVGGCVRDFLLGRKPGDYDVATSARPEQIEALFPKTIPVGRKFGVIIVLVGDEQFQVATFRAEADYRDGRRPETVRFADARADAERRDFTVNGLFYDPIAEKIHDWVGGEVDLRARLIRTIGSPDERFAEDHLRLLRAVRLATQLEFEIEPGTFAAIKTHAAKIQLISAERIRDELIKLFGSAHASRGLELLRESGLLEYVLPEIAATVNCEQSPEHHPEGSVFNHLRLMLAKMPPDAPLLLPWAVLLHDVAKPLTASRDPQTGSIHFYEHEKIGAELTEKILERLRFPRKDIETVATVVRYHMQFKDARQMRKATLRRMLLRETFSLELQLHRLDCLGSNGRLDAYNFLVEQQAELARQPEMRPPLLTGNDLIALGLKPGPEIGALLNEIRDKQLAEELRTREEALEWVTQRFRDQSRDQ